MQNNKNNIILSLIILILSFLNIIFNTTNISALSYQSEVGIGFTFNPTLSVSLSSSDLTISNLTPGSSENSNSINVSIATNASYGYTLSVNANNDNLTHSNNMDTFSSIATDASLQNLTTDNTWGYSTSLDNGATWSNYNGLSSSSNAILLDNSNAADSTGSVDFKIAAKAGNTQPSGEYTGTINFTAVTNVAPMSLLDSFIASGAEQLNGYYKMQDMTHDICEAVDVEESELRLIDVRDNKVYWVAKLKDGNCWMTQNLDLDLSSSVALTSETSDINPESYGKTIYTVETGYSKDETTGIVSWLPSNIDSDDVQRADTMGMVWNDDNATTPYWNYSYDKPLSADPGVKYRYTNPFSFNENTYSSLETCSSENSDDAIGCQHAYFGNYYNWPAAVASNNAHDASGNQINSICSKNWSLPVNNNYKTMLTIQKIYNGSNGYTSNGFNNFRTSPLYFTPFGYISPNSLIGLGRNGRYWSKTAYSDDGISYSLSFNNSGGLWPTSHSGYDARFYGFSVRCIAE